MDHDLRAALDYAEKGILLARSAGNRRMEGCLLLDAGRIYHKLSDNDRASGCLGEAMEIADKTGDGSLSLDACIAMGNLCNTRRQPRQAMELYQKALTTAEKTGDRKRQADIYTNMGAVLAGQNQWSRAIPHYFRSVEIARETGNDEQTAINHFNLALAYRALSDMEIAGMHFLEADRLAGELGNKSLKVSTLQGLATYYGWKGEHEQALSAASLAMTTAEQMGSPDMIADTRKNMAFSLLSLGDHGKAVDIVAGLLPQLDSTQYKQYYDLHYVATVANIKMGRQDSALSHLEQMLRYIGKNNDEQSLSALAEMEAVYETEKKEIRITSLGNENRLYLTLILVVAFATIVLALAFIVYSRYQRLKRWRSQEEMERLRRDSQLVAARSLLEGEIHERERLSGELHDGLGGLLTMIKLHLTRAREKPQENLPRLDQAIEFTDRVIDDMRRMAHNLMPESLARFGLKPVLEQYCNGADIVNFHFFGKERRLEQRVFNPQIQMLQDNRTK